MDPRERRLGRAFDVNLATKVDLILKAVVNVVFCVVKPTLDAVSVSPGYWPASEEGQGCRDCGVSTSMEVVSLIPSLDGRAHQTLTASANSFGKIASAMLDISHVQLGVDHRRMTDETTDDGSA